MLEEITTMCSFLFRLTCEDVAIVGEARGERGAIVEREVRSPLAEPEGLLERVVLFPRRLRLIDGQ